MTVTVFTPTYNRGYIISQLYNSLKSQTSKNFEWIIIDDGSTDNTKEIINQFILENIINIKYIYQENSGKQRAINNGVKLAKGELFFIVDSDDFIEDDAISKIEKKWMSIHNKEGYAGLCYRKKHITNNKIIGQPYPEQEFDSTSLDLAYKYNINVDKAEIFKTDILGKYQFPEIEGEKFVPEAYIWFKIANDDYKLRCCDDGIYCCEYLPDGLSSNFIHNLRKNPTGFLLFYKNLLSYPQPSIMVKCKALIRLLQCYYYKIIKK